MRLRISKILALLYQAIFQIEILIIVFKQVKFRIINPNKTKKQLIFQQTIIFNKHSQHCLIKKMHLKIKQISAKKRNQSKQIINGPIQQKNKMRIISKKLSNLNKKVYMQLC